MRPSFIDYESPLPPPGAKPKPKPGPKPKPKPVTTQAVGEEQGRQVLPPQTRGETR
ncbi:MAG TPA: hypothetical protein VFA20_32150 [Myxococcaceae bacterium]|nr:hypothetical protein [Myxococcaceae bacterium]